MQVNICRLHNHNVTPARVCTLHMNLKYYLQLATSLVQLINKQFCTDCSDLATL